MWGVGGALKAIHLIRSLTTALERAPKRGWSGSFFQMQVIFQNEPPSLASSNPAGLIERDRSQLPLRYTEICYRKRVDFPPEENYKPRDHVASVSSRGYKTRSP